MKKYFFLVVILLVLVNTAGAQNFEWGWSIGDVGFTLGDIGSSDAGAWSFSLLNTQFIFSKRLGINTSLFWIQTDNSGPLTRHSILPVEISYYVCRFEESLNWSLYGRGQWQFIKPENTFWDSSFFPDNNRLYGAVGTRLSFFAPSEILHYSFYSSIFFEYTCAKELKIGVNVDGAIVAVLLGVLFAATADSDKTSNSGD